MSYGREFNNKYGYVANDPVNWIDPEGLQSSALDQVRQQWYPPAPTQSVPLSLINTRQWLCRGVKSEVQGHVDAYTYLQQGRNFGLDKLDSNLTAAERYMEGYDGNYPKFMIYGQHLSKQARKATNLMSGNGSPVGDSGWITLWGLAGADDAKNDMPIGWSLGGSLGECSCSK